MLVCSEMTDGQDGTAATAMHRVGLSAPGPHNAAAPNTTTDHKQLLAVRKAIQGVLVALRDARPPTMFAAEMIRNGHILGKGVAVEFRCPVRTLVHCLLLHDGCPWCHAMLSVRRDGLLVCGVLNDGLGKLEVTRGQRQGIRQRGIRIREGAA